MSGENLSTIDKLNMAGSPLFGAPWTKTRDWALKEQFNPKSFSEGRTDPFNSWLMDEYERNNQKEPYSSPQWAMDAYAGVAPNSDNQNVVNAVSRARGAAERAGEDPMNLPVIGGRARSSALNTLSQNTLPLYESLYKSQAAIDAKKKSIPDQSNLQGFLGGLMDAFGGGAGGGGGGMGGMMDMSSMFS